MACTNCIRVQAALAAALVAVTAALSEVESAPCLNKGKGKSKSTDKGTGPSRSRSRSPLALDKGKGKNKDKGSPPIAVDAACAPSALGYTPIVGSDRSALDDILDGMADEDV